MQIKAQESGNINYRNPNTYNNYQQQNTYPNLTTQPGHANTSITVRGLYNLKADEFVAIFSITQFGKTTVEVNQMMDTRVNQAITNLKSIPDLNVFTDMVSFVPVYEYEVEKKIFSKTYTEVPNGFELKKNLHVHYKNSEQLKSIMTELSAVEIYDLVKVDYYSSKMDIAQNELITKATERYRNKLKQFENITGYKSDSMSQKMQDAFYIKYPVESYQAYQCFSSSTFYSKKAPNVNYANKSTTMFYNGAINHNSDFVINPVLKEPVIQIFYEMTVELAEKDKKNAYILGNDGSLRKLDLGK